jgi:hypothetical protein
MLARLRKFFSGLLVTPEESRAARIRECRLGLIREIADFRLLASKAELEVMLALLETKGEGRYSSSS